MTPASRVTRSLITRKPWFFDQSRIKFSHSSHEVKLFPENKDAFESFSTLISSKHTSIYENKSNKKKGGLNPNKQTKQINQATKIDKTFKELSSNITKGDKFPVKMN